jgi:hypothetical protein
MVDLNMAPNTKICKYTSLEDCKTRKTGGKRKTGKKRQEDQMVCTDMYEFRKDAIMVM